MKGENRMKRLLVFISMITVLSLCLVTVRYAQDMGEGTEISNYLRDRVMPIVAGVLTSAIALISTLYSIGKSLKGLKGIKEELSAEAKSRRESLAGSTALLEGRTEEIKAILKDVPQLQGEIKELERGIEELREQSYILGEILSLGFSADEDIIKSGKGARMASLLERSGREISRNEEN
ncbi:MAG: hypothetical protein J6B29_00800 [Clostridia bacterium]|nr:hypothetical protein [Clostridia bacterium]